MIQKLCDFVIFSYVTVAVAGVILAPFVVIALVIKYLTQ